MKKFVVLLVVVALTLVTSAVFAAEVTVGGEVAVRSRNFDNMDMSDATPDTAALGHRDTQQRLKIDVNAKAGDVKGKIQLWNDFETWGGFEAQNGSALGIREAWVNFNLPGLPVNVTAGHQLLTLGNGWFFRSMHFGSDAWVVATKMGDNTLAFVNVKFAENDAQQSDDADAYSILGAFKLNDDMKIGFDVTNLVDRTDKAGATPSKVNLYNVGVNFNGKVGPVALKAELDMQAGDLEDLSAGGTDSSFKGNQLVVQGSVAVAPVTLNFTVARGSGDDNAADNDIESFQNALDIDPHYTFLYEYKMAGPSGTKNFGFSNTTALGIGATFAATKSLTIGADFWHLMATEDVPNVVGAGTTDEIGQEIDVKVNWKVADNLNWNWVVGMFMPGDGMGKDDATGIQGILSFAF
jgi:hypothetical protein